MTLEDARPFIIRYGRCIYCNTLLRAAESVERGVGPVCAGKFAPPREPEPKLTDDQTSDLLARLSKGFR